MSIRSRRTLSLGLIFLFICGFLSLVFAQSYPTAVAVSSVADDQAALDELQAKADSIKKQQQELADKIAAVNGQYDNLLEEKLDLEKQISLILEEIDLTTTLIERYHSAVSNLERTLYETQNQLEQYYVIYGEILRYYYERGQAGMMEILLQSSDFSDFLTRLDYVNYMLEYSGKVAEQIKEANDSVSAQMTLYNDYGTALERYKEDQLTAQAELEKKNTSLLTLQAELDAHKDEYAHISDQYANQENSCAAEIEALYEQIQQKLEVSRAEESSRQAAIDASRAEESSRALAAASQAAADDPYLKPVDVSQTPTLSNGSYLPPIDGKYWSKISLSASFGDSSTPSESTTGRHNGIDIKAKSGTPIQAVMAGTVIKSEFSSTFGNVIVIAHSDGTSTMYAHCASRLVATGASVLQGQVIARVGSTGASLESHLHFAVVQNGAYVNPSPYLSSEFKQAIARS